LWVLSLSRLLHRFIVLLKIYTDKMKKIDLEKGFTQLVDFGNIPLGAGRVHTSPKLTTGFTLMEMLVVIGLVGVIATMSLFIDINSFRGDAFRSEVNNLGIALQTARADALNNIDQERHGVAIKPVGYDGYVVFEGNSYDTRDNSKDENTKSSYEVNFSPTSPTEITFDQLSGNAEDTDITMIDPNRNITAVISINHEGKISW
jgi:prepilin-type N-terminal cleavage/methylation domain-containing protein